MHMWQNIHFLNTKSLACMKKRKFQARNLIFIIQHVESAVIPCPHQPPTRGDNTVSGVQGGTATPGATKQLFHWTGY